jgi:ABC-2 type transport system ATP-binding protein
MVGLSHAKYRQVGEFSKGMARRIGLAQAMINDPALLILDEPTSGLDPIGCKEVKDLILLLKRRGKTVIVTSHLLSDVEDVCDRVVILYGGKIRATGALNELLTIQESTRIVAPQLPPQTMERLLAILREQLKGDSFVVDKPRMTLEDFFLDVVNKAKTESLETSGAVSGGHIAEYLSNGASLRRQGFGKDNQELLEPASKKSDESAIEAPKLDESKLKGLVDGSVSDVPQAVANETGGATSSDRKAELSEANKKLGGLLQPKDEGGSGATP